MLNQRQASGTTIERIKPPIHPMFWLSLVGIMLLGLFLSVPLIKNYLSLPLIVILGLVVLLAFWEIGQQAYRAGRNLYLWQYTRTCAGQVVELGYDHASGKDSTHEMQYIISVEFPAGPGDKMFRLRAQISRELYLRLKPGGPVSVQYSKANPAIALIEGE
jgi:hypothetical protein